MTTYHFKTNKYLTYYQDIVAAALQKQRSKKDDYYYENHHIIPKSLGGANTKTNMVLLTAREHFVLHLLLVRIVQDSDVYRMVNAIRRFRNKVSNSREFELLRSTISKYSKGHLNPAHGRIWAHNISTQEILYVTKIDFESMDQAAFKKGLPYQRGGHRGTVWLNNGQGETVINKSEIDDYLKQGWSIGRLTAVGVDHLRYMASRRHTKEKDLAHSQKLSGENHFNYGKPAFTKGRVWVNNKVESKMIAPDDLPAFVTQGWVRGRLRPQ